MFVHSALTDVSLPSSSTRVVGSAFVHSALTDGSLPSSSTRVVGSAFAHSAQTDGSLPSSSTRVVGSAFAHSAQTDGLSAQHCERSPSVRHGCCRLQGRSAIASRGFRRL